MASPRNGGSGYGCSQNRPRSGVVDYPISKNMALTGIWSYEPNSNGPVITAEQGALDISRRPMRNAHNQWTKLCIQHHFDAQSGIVITFKVRYDVVQPATEVKLTLACGIILRYDGGVLNYCCWDPNTEWFHNLGPSSIRIGDGKFCRVALCICPNAIHIFENGNRIGMRRSQVSSPFQPTFNWQILAADAALQATLSEILVVTTSFLPGVNTPWDICFSSSPSPPTDDVWQIIRQDHNPFRINFSPDNYIRFSTRRLSFRNSWVFTQATSPLISGDGILMYRLHVNAAWGSETKITLFGGYTLRLTKNGQHAKWVLYINQHCFGSEGEGDSESNVRVGSGVWTVVLLVYSPSSVTLFEDGVVKFSSSRRALSSPRAPLFHVQHLDAGTAVEVDLSHVRSVPVIRTSEDLMRGLKPHLIAYYPFSDRLSEAVSAPEDSPWSSLGPFPAVQGYDSTALARRPIWAVDSIARTTQGALRVSPLLDSPVRSSTPPSNSLSPSFSTSLSYTLALWLRVEQYPSGQEDRAGSVGPISLRPGGRLEFSFGRGHASSGSNTESQPKIVAPPPPFVSTATIPLLQWVSVAVTYAFEDSRFALFIDGEMDSVVYTTPTADNPSPYVIMLMACYIGAASSSDDMGKLMVLRGQIEHVILFNQYFHHAVARALENCHPPI